MLETTLAAEVRRQGKVVFVNRYFYPDESATSRILSDLAFRLARLGLKIEVVTSRQLYDDPGAQLPALEAVGGVTLRRVRTATRGRSHLAGRTLDYLSFHLAAMATLVRLLEPDDLVVAMTDPPLLSISVSRLASLRRARHVNWLQDLFPEVATALDVRLPPQVDSRLRALRDGSLRCADLNVVLGERMQEYLLARGVARERVRMVPNWTDAARVIPIEKTRSATRTGLALDDRFVVGYSGNLGRAHEFDTLLSAAKLLRADRRFAFLIIGAGAKINTLRRAVEAEQLESFRFLPYQPPESLTDSLGAADVHLVSLLPRLEGLIVPSKLYGILAAGRPTIFVGDRDGEVARVVRQGECGLTVAPGEAAELVRAIRALEAAPETCSEMGRRARELAVARYSSERACALWRTLLGEIAPGVLPECGLAAADRATAAVADR